MVRAVIRRYRDAFSGLPREIWLLAFALFVNRSGAMVMTFMTLYLTSQLGMSESGAGRMISLYGLGAVCGAFWGGRLSHRLGGVRLQTVCLFLSAPGFLVLPLWKSWPPLALSLLCLSLVSEAVRPANAAAIANLSTRETRTRAFALNRLAANLGFSFGPVIGGVLATIDFKLLFVVDALTTLAAAVMMLWFFGMRRFDAPAHEATAVRVGTSPLKDRTFVLLLALLLPSMVVFFQLGSTYPLYMRDHFQMSKRLIGLMFAVNTTVIVAVEMLLIDAISHWKPLRTIGWGCFLSCLGFGMLPFGSTALFAVAAMLVVTAGEMLSFSISVGFVANRGAHGSEARYMGWYTFMFATASVLGPAIGSAIYQVNHDAVWLCGLGVGVLVLIGFQLLARANAETGADSPQIGRSAGSDEPAAAALVPLPAPELIENLGT